MTDRSSDRSLVAEPILPAYQQVADQLRGSILRGDVEPGDRLPVEAELAEMFGVSRSTIREALRVLSSERLLRTVRGVGGGSFVLQPDPEHVSDFLQTSIGLLTGTHQVSLEELVEARTRLEVAAAGFAARRATPDDVERLRLASRATLADDDGNFETSREFHFVLLQIAGNRLMEVLAAPVFNVLAQRYLGAISAGAWGALERDHAAIVEAIAAGDPDGAAALMSDHVAGVGALYRLAEEDRAGEED